MGTIAELQCNMRSESFEPSEITFLRAAELNSYLGIQLQNENQEALDYLSNIFGPTPLSHVQIATKAD